MIFDAESKSVVKNFSLYQALWTLFFLRVGGGRGFVIFDAESKSVVKNFSLYQALWTLFFLRVGGEGVCDF